MVGRIAAAQQAQRRRDRPARGDQRHEGIERHPAGIGLPQVVLRRDPGRLVGGAYAREEGALVRHFVQDRRLAGYRYDGVTGVFPRSTDDRGQLGGVGFVGFGPPPETEQTCAACLALNERGAEGYRAVWAAVGPGYKFDRRMEVVLEAYRP